MKRLPSANVKRKPAVPVKHSLRSHEAKRPHLSVRRSRASLGEALLHFSCTVRCASLKKALPKKCFFMVETTGLDSRACGRLVARGRNSPPDCCSVPLVLRAPMQKKKRPPSDEGSRFLVETTGLDSRACGRLVARGHNSPPDCCSVPLVLRAPMQKKKRPPSDEGSRFLVETTGLEPVTSCV